MMKQYGKIAAVMGGLLLITACGSSLKEMSTRPMVKIAIATEGRAQELDATTYDASMALYGAVYQPLIEYGEKGKFKPGLAQSWDISPDGKRIVFHLKSNMKFSDGSAVDANSVKFTIERAKHNNQKSTLQTLSNLDSVKALDARTVEFNFSKVSNQVLNELCQARPLRIMSPNSVEGQKASGKFIKAIGSGAFTVTKATAESTVLSPNSFFDQSKPVNYDVTFQTITDGSARTMALKSGDIDITGGSLGMINDTDIQQLEKDNNQTIHKFDGTMSHFMGFNPDNAKLTNKVRSAINHAIDKNNLSRHRLKGIFRSNVQYVTADNQPLVQKDLETTRQLLEQEGYSKNNQGIYVNGNGELNFNLVIQTAEFPEWKEKSEIIEKELNDAGIRTSIQILDSESYYDVLWKTKKYDLILYRTYTDALLPFNFMKSIYANTSDEHGVLSNDPQLTTLLDDFENLMEESQKQTKFNEIFSHFYDETLAVPVDYKDEVFVTSKRITTFDYAGLTDVPINFKTLRVR